MRYPSPSRSSGAETSPLALLPRPPEQRSSDLLFPLVGLAASTALLAGSVLQKGVNALLFGPASWHVTLSVDIFDAGCSILLLLLNPPLFAFVIALLAFPTLVPPAPLAIILELSIVLSWWLAFAWLWVHRPSRSRRVMLPTLRDRRRNRDAA